MSTIKEQLTQLLDDPAKVDAILAITEGRLSPQQRWRQSDKGKDSKRKSNAKYAAKEKPVDQTAAQKFLQAVPPQSVTYESLSELWCRYKTWSLLQQKIRPVKMLEFKSQLADLNVPIVQSYLNSTGKRVHRKVYKLDTSR